MLPAKKKKKKDYFFLSQGMNASFSLSFYQYEDYIRIVEQALFLRT